MVFLLSIKHHKWFLDWKKYPPHTLVFLLRLLLSLVWGVECIYIYIYIYMSMEIDYKVLTQELVSDSSGVVDC